MIELREEHFEILTAEQIEMMEWAALSLPIGAEIWPEWDEDD